jgi:hypothetical protein
MLFVATGVILVPTVGINGKWSTYRNKELQIYFGWPVELAYFKKGPKKIHSDEVGFTYGRPSPPMRSDSRTDKQTLKNPSRKIALILVCKGYGTLSYPLHARIHVRMYLPYPFLNDAWYLDCISHSKKGMASTLGFRYGCAKGMTFCHTLSTPESVTFFGGSFWSMLARRWSTEMLLRFQFLKTVHVLCRLS